MVQFKILSGNKAGSSWDARHFPVRIGRSAKANLRLEEAGVWDDHFTIRLDPAEGFVAEAHANALASINGQPVQRAVLRNGDTIEIGSVKIQFWLAEARQRGQGMREALVWMVISAVCFAQIALVYWLLTQE
jgi:pSer/pThr/pTyr-binding forkhead associated (FHA) protein